MSDACSYADRVKAELQIWRQLRVYDLEVYLQETHTIYERPELRSSLNDRAFEGCLTQMQGPRMGFGPASLAAHGRRRRRQAMPLSQDIADSSAVAKLNMSHEPRWSFRRASCCCAPNMHWYGSRMLRTCRGNRFGVFLFGAHVHLI